MNKTKIIIENIRDIINANDPVGLVGGGAPDDEYEREVMAIMSMLQIKTDSDVIRNCIERIFNDSFGPSAKIDVEQINKITNELVALKERLQF